MSRCDTRCTRASKSIVACALMPPRTPILFMPCLLGNVVPTRQVYRVAEFPSSLLDFGGLRGYVYRIVLGADNRGRQGAGPGINNHRAQRAAGRGTATRECRVERRQQERIMRQAMIVRDVVGGGVVLVFVLAWTATGMG